MKKITAIIILVLILAVSGASAQQDSRVKYEKTLSYNFRNVNNEFQLNGVGKVVIKGSPDQQIRCEVKVTGYGKTVEDAKAIIHNARSITERADKMMGGVSKIGVKPSVDVLYSGGAHRWSANATPRLRVFMSQGRYNEHNCKVVTTVYLPPTVVMQHNDDVSLMDYVYRVLNKVKMLR